MKPEDKELLLKDLCARLPYGVKVDRLGKTFTLASVFPNRGVVFLDDGDSTEYEFFVDEAPIKPYLRPMSSMTEEEIIEFNNIPSTKNYTIIENDLPWAVAHYKQIDWLNKKMFDFRGLIPKDIALSTEEYNHYKD